MIGFIGEFVRGKSALIHHVKKKRAEDSKEEKWIQFEAWSFPERRDLWEGFVLESARQIDATAFGEARESIDCTQNDDVKTLVDIVIGLHDLADILIRQFWAKAKEGFVSFAVIFLGGGFGCGVFQGDSQPLRSQFSECSVTLRFLGFRQF